MYPVIETVETKGFYKQNVIIAGCWNEIDPCVHREELPFYVPCVQCGKFMAKHEIDYEKHNLESYTWLENKLIEINKDYTYMIEHIDEENKKIEDDNQHRSEDKQKQLWIKETLEERRDNQILEAETHGRINWLKNKLRELINENKEIMQERKEQIVRANSDKDIDKSVFEKGIKCMVCRA